MLRFMRNNPSVAAGILLPLVVAAFFVLATAIPRWLAAPPAHDFLFVKHEYRQEPPAISVRFDVAGDRLRVQAYKADAGYRNVPRLYRYEHETNTVHELAVDYPADVDDVEDGTVLAVPELDGVRVSPARQAPDGYVVVDPGYRRGGLVGWFFGRRSGTDMTLRKDGAIVEVPAVDSRQPYYGNTTFLGWVIESDE